jgi:hypothetical protein
VLVQQACVELEVRIYRVADQLLGLRNKLTVLVGVRLQQPARGNEKCYDILDAWHAVTVA